MQASRSFALAALPGAAAIALWGAYRHTVNELSVRWTAPPHLTGDVRTLPTPWGRLSYRLVAGTDLAAPPLVLVHGWGRSADSMWWQLIGQTDRTTLVVDLPGHGRSLLEAPFTFDLAAEAVSAAIADAGLARPIIIGGGQAGLSMGYHLAQRRRPFLIVDVNDRIGDAWRNRWDSLRLFTPSRLDGLDGMPFPRSTSFLSHQG